MTPSARSRTRSSICPVCATSNSAVLEKVRSPRNIVNAKIGWRSPDDHLSIALYAENLLDKRYYRTLNSISADIFNTPYVRADRPGFYGAGNRVPILKTLRGENGMTNRIALLGCAAALALVGGCSGGPKTDAQGFVIDPDFEKNLQQKLLDAKPGDGDRYPGAANMR